MSLTRDTSYNIVGAAVPILVTIVSIPLLLKELGIELFGVYSLILVILGLFRIFDFGVGRAVSREIAKIRGEGRDTSGSCGKAIILTIPTSISAGVILFGLAQTELSLKIGINENFTEDIISTSVIIALTASSIVVSSVLSATLIGYQRFARLNIVIVTVSILNQSLPLLAIIFFGASLYNLMSAVLTSRLVEVIFLIFTLKSEVRPKISSIKIEEIGKFLNYGGWVTLSNIAGPVMTAVERTMISRSLGVDVLSYYAVPAQACEKINIANRSFANALFPILAKSQSFGEFQRSVNNSQFISGVFVLIVMAIAILFSDEVLRLWVSDDFSDFASPVAKILVFGYGVNALAYIPFTALQANGQPKKVAMAHLCEIPLYFVILLVLINNFGLMGAGFAFSMRAVIDLLILTLLQRDGRKSLIFNVVIISILFAILLYDQHPVTLERYLN